MIDLINAKKSFKEYISNYDFNNPRIQLKIIHMYHVAENSKRIACSLNLSEEKQELAELVGLLHDIGRFEQVRLYGTFSDRISIDHGQKGYEVLKSDNMLRKFVETDEYDSIILKSVVNHNKYEIDKDLSDEELLFTKVVRDADNIDIYRVALETERIEELGHFDCKDISKEKLTPECFEEFKKEKLLLYSKAKTDMDIMLAIIAHLFSIEFSESLKIIKENDYINLFVNRLNCQDSYTDQKMKEVANIAMNYINREIKERG